jgi:hypothetical protein
MDLSVREQAEIIELIFNVESARRCDQAIPSTSTPQSDSVQSRSGLTQPQPLRLLASEQRGTIRDDFPRLA